MRHTRFLLLAAFAALIVGPATAAVPTDDPTFSDPTEFDNPFFPFEANGMKVYKGKSDGEKVTVVYSYLEETRDFDWNGGTVECVVLVETEFEGGELAEISWNYFASADDDTVYYFGEVVNEYDEGEVESHEGSWLVGGPSGDDPAETFAAADPAVFFPGDPEGGDTWNPEDVPGGPLEIAEIRKTDKKVKVPFGKFEDCIEVLETHPADDATEKKWYAPGVGLLKEKGKGEKLKLIASSFLAEDDE